MRYKKSEISVAHIVDAAMRVLARQGYAHSSLMDIANEVGMSKGAVHYHFPTKEALITQVLETALDKVARGTTDPAFDSDSRFELRQLRRTRFVSGP